MKRRELNFAVLGAAGLYGLGNPHASVAQTTHIAPSAKLLAMRTWPAPESFRLTLEYAGSVKVESFLLDDATPRLVVDVHGLAWNTASETLLNQSLSQNTMVERYRAAAQAATGAVRLVLDLKRASVAEVNTVAAVGPYQSRVLIDIYPANTDLLGLWLLRQSAGKGIEKTLENPIGNAANKTSTNVLVVEPKVVTALSNKPAASTTTSPPPAQSAAPAVHTTKKATQSSKIIAIDAGHGGEDPGAIGPAGTQEKDVVLAMALQLAQRLRSRLGWKVVLTRDGDYFVPLAQRVQLARTAKADLFVSLHADAFYTPTAKGASVYALSDKGASSAAAKWIANKENNADLIGGLNLSTKDKQLSSVLLDLSTTAQIKTSLKLGKSMVQHLGGIAHLHKKQVEQAGFAVLKAPDIPSLLIETAFISHPDEERLLGEPAHQAKIVAAISRSIATLT